MEEEAEAKASKAKMTENMQKQSDAIIGISSTFTKLIEGMGARGLDNANGSNELQDTVKEIKESMAKQGDLIEALAKKQDDNVKIQGESLEKIMSFMHQMQQKFQ